MEKIITLSRRELVWELRENVYAENDYKILVDALKKRAQEEGEHLYVREARAFIKAIDDNNITWDDVVAIFKGEKDNIDFEVVAESGYSYTNSIEEIIREDIRENNYNSDVIDYDYADDYEEQFYFNEKEDN